MSYQLLIRCLSKRMFMPYNILYDYTFLRAIFRPFLAHLGELNASPPTVRDGF